ncbi:UdgX family uracil-DNA binding protein [Massilia sp. CF038]|uniref:UdgX family uracil-DNA binding protein n=1 Tax=Massilia sp. CF038 TaxID=1881045 RepID=UPI00091490AB|nr:DNA polymerase [Massilia sp. CF038]
MGGTASSVSAPAAAATVAAGRPLLVHSFDEWRRAARDLLAHQVAPHQVQWISHKDGGDLFAHADADPATVVTADAALAPAQAQAAMDGHAPGAAAPRISRKLMDMLQTAACCRVPNRWAFLYLVLWRWQQGEHAVISAADEDGAKLHAMVKAVKREEHDMHAYIRFRERRDDAGPPRFVAWFEPAHDVLPQVAKHFASRMGRVTWMIATPDASVMWDGCTLHSTGPLMRGPEDIVDAGEALWLTYYRSIFNPARLNAELMHGHIPSRFWKNLPEGSVVPAMVSQAATGARQVGQTRSVGARGGTAIPIAADKAQPQRQAPSTLDACRRCPLWEHATQAVAGVGPAQARIMLVGEQPGDQEDLAGLPFVGPAGQLLERALEQAALDRRTVYLTNAVKHFKWEPRGKRRMHKTPAQREVEACNYWLESELAQVQPNVIVALGSTALKAITGNPHAALKDVLGQPFQHQGRWIVTIYHPAYVLRVPGEANKQQAMTVMVEGLREARRLAL